MTRYLALPKWTALVLLALSIITAAASGVWLLISPRCYEGSITFERKPSDDALQQRPQDAFMPVEVVIPRTLHIYLNSEVSAWRCTHISPTDLYQLAVSDASPGKASAAIKYSVANLLRDEKRRIATLAVHPPAGVIPACGPFIWERLEPIGPMVPGKRYCIMVICGGVTAAGACLLVLSAQRKSRGFRHGV